MATFIALHCLDRALVKFHIGNRKVLNHPEWQYQRLCTNRVHTTTSAPWLLFTAVTSSEVHYCHFVRVVKIMVPINTSMCIIFLSQSTYLFICIHLENYPSTSIRQFPLRTHCCTDLHHSLSHSIWFPLLPKHVSTDLRSTHNTTVTAARTRIATDSIENQTLRSRLQRPLNCSRRVHNH